VKGFELRTPPHPALSHFLRGCGSGTGLDRRYCCAWSRTLKHRSIDGYRIIAFKTGGKVHLRSRNDRDFSRAYPAILQALSGLPDETGIDGEIVALDDAGRASFNALREPSTRGRNLDFEIDDYARRTPRTSIRRGDEDITGLQFLPDLL
jgi:hypothetical protein